MIQALFIVAAIVFAVVASRCERHRDDAAESAGEVGKIVIDRDYLAELNAEAIAVPEEERAWTHLRAAAIRLTDTPEELNEAHWPMTAESPLFGKACEHLRENAEVLEMIRKAAVMPRLGVVLSYRGDPILEEALCKRREVEYTPDPAKEKPQLFDVRMPQIGSLRFFTRLMVMDTRWAVVEKDGERVCRNVETIFRLACLTQQMPSLTCKRTAMAIGLQGISAITECVQDSPDLLTDEQLVRIESSVSGYAPDAWLRQGLIYERMYFEDVLQHTFTNDGHGDGQLTPEGWKLLNEMTGQNEENARLVGLFLQTASRKEMKAEYEASLRVVEDFFDMPMWQWSEGPGEPVKRRQQEDGYHRKYMVSAVMLPETGKAVISSNTASSCGEGAQVAIALSRYRLKHGRYPQQLSELVPDFLAGIPVDRFDGQPLRYRLTDGKPTVYSVGADRVDSGGKPTSPPGEAMVWRSPDELAAWRSGEKILPRIKEGDWLLMPVRAGE
ncbi:MAG: hypothetical protein H7210_06130 [Pyrinomonadaceae bacterium]|nr:hypothetical protein [Phycisphaerales bacterium]